jgi:hypothetical protein
MSELSIVTVCMNRREHLLATAPKVAAWPHHSEHVIVDWSGAEPVRRQELPDDPRVRLLRVEGEAGWNLSRAYNFALAQARGAWLLKLDADCWPTSHLTPQALMAAGRAWVGSGGKGRHGQFLMERACLDAAGGFNEYLSGWGFEDKDLHARLEVREGIGLGRLPTETIGVIEHSDEERMGQLPGGRGEAFRRDVGLAAMRSSRLANRLLAAHYPWGPLTTRSRYEEWAPDRWRVLPGSVPRPSGTAASKVEHARRLAFWSCLLAIPEVFLADLPIKLAPYPHQGVWRVRWWHRLWWHSGRRLSRLPVFLLSRTRGWLGRPTESPPGAPRDER